MITADGLKQAIANETAILDENSTPEEAQTALAKAIVDYLKANLDVKIPVASVITSVAGGSGAPAIGAPNTTPINCNVN